MTVPSADFVVSIWVLSFLSRSQLRREDSAKLIGAHAHQARYPVAGGRGGLDRCRRDAENVLRPGWRVRRRLSGVGMSSPGVFADLAAQRACWHPVAFAREVADRPVHADLLGEPLVIWRGADGVR